MDDIVPAFGWPGSWLAWATAAAAIAGVVYVLSPMSVVFAVAFVWIVRRADRGLAGCERRWVHGLLIVATAIRLAAIATLFLRGGQGTWQWGTFVGDEIYTKQRPLWMLNLWLEKPIGPEYLFFVSDREYGQTGLHYILAYLQMFLGPMPYGVHLFSLILFLAAAVLLHRVIRRAYGSAAALGGLALLLFWPTQVIWSIAAMKESLHFLLGAMAIAASVMLVRAAGWRARLGAILMLVVSFAGLATVREGAIQIAALGIAGGLALRFLTLRWWIAAAAVLVLLIIGPPLARRAHLADRATAQIRYSATIHRGHALTRGHGYKVLEPGFYIEGSSRVILEPIEATRFVVRALVAFVTVPLPWQMISRPELAVLPQQIVWLCVVPLAFVGLMEGLRRDPLVTLIFAAYLAVAMGVIALNSGNIGTLVRHRDTMFVPFVVWPAAVGAVWIFARLAPRRAASQ